MPDTLAHFAVLERCCTVEAVGAFGVSHSGPSTRDGKGLGQALGGRVALWLILGCPPRN